MSWADFATTRRLDQLHQEFPSAGSRTFQGLPVAQGGKIARRLVIVLIWTMGTEALYHRPSPTKPEPRHKIYPYLLRSMVITRPNQVWAMDVTYIRWRVASCISLSCLTGQIVADGDTERWKHLPYLNQSFRLKLSASPFMTDV